jgi:hypothetical protein
MASESMNREMPLNIKLIPTSVATTQAEADPVSPDKQSENQRDNTIQQRSRLKVATGIDLNHMRYRVSAS